MIMGLALADSVHIATTVGQQLRSGHAKSEAIKNAIRLNFSPVCLTSLTTVIGFLTLNFSNSPPLRQLGNMVSVGVGAAFIYSIVFLPALLSVVPAPGSGLWSGGTRVWRWFGGFVVARPRLLLAGFILVSVPMIAGAHRIVFDDDFIKYFDHSYEFRRDTDFLQSHVLGMNVLEYSLPSGEEQGITRPDYLRKLDAFASWFRAQHEVFNVDALSDVIKRLNKNMHDDDEAFATIPDSRQLAAQLLLLYETSLPSGQDLNSQIDIAKSSTLMIVYLKDLSSAEIRALGERGERWLQENAPEMATPATGLSIIYAYLSERNVRGMLAGTFVGLVAISFIMLVIMRSLTIGLVSLVPNLIPASMAFGLWGYLYGQVNLAVSVVGAMTLGIIVDDTIHFLTHYLRARRELGLDAPHAVRHTLETVGSALVLTSVALTVGFGVLATSGFAVSAQMGLLSAITIVLALAADLLLLPALLLVRSKPPRTVPSVAPRAGHPAGLAPK